MTAFEIFPTISDQFILGFCLGIISASVVLIIAYILADRM